MSQQIKDAAGYPSTTFDTKIPSLSDAANIVEAFKLYHYGIDNYDGSVSPAASSIEQHLRTFDTRLDGVEAAPFSFLNASATLATRINSASVSLYGIVNSASTSLYGINRSASVSLYGTTYSASTGLIATINSSSTIINNSISNVEALAMLGL